MDTSRRRAALRAELADVADGYLSTNLVNVRWLTGFTGSAGAVLIGADGRCVLATDGRYETQAAGQASDCEVVVSRTPPTSLIDVAVQAGWRSVAIERHHVTLTTNDRLLAAAAGSLSLVDGAAAVERLRVHKDADELAALANACAITDDVFAAVLSQLRPGVSERDIAWSLRAEMHSRGAAPAFDSIIAFGPNSARPHHQPTDRTLATGDFVKLDFGAAVDGYHADMTRTVVVGPASDWQRDLHSLVLGIQREAVAEVRPGAVPVELDSAVRRRIEASGHQAAHGLGHGVGLEIHELPFLVPESTEARLVDGVPVTVEPGIYLPGRGGVRIEDTVVVRAGGAESLTSSPRDLIEI